MRNLFRGYYTPTKEELAAFWKECIFSFDASVLLNIYRYGPQARKSFFDVLTAVREQIWVPFQAAHEYHTTRMSIIEKQREPYDKLDDLLTDQLAKVKQVLDGYGKRHSFDSYVKKEQIIASIEETHKALRETLNQAQDQLPGMDEYDDFHRRLADLFEGKTGNPYPQEKLEEIYSEAEKRFEAQVPPGYLDKKKPVKEERYGDVVIWHQLIDHAKSERKPIIFVTDDVKEDWWTKQFGQRRGPRTELAQEMWDAAEVSFWLHTSDVFLERAKEFLSLSIESEVVEEARDIRLEQLASQPPNPPAKKELPISLQQEMMDTIRSEMSRSEDVNYLRKIAPGLDPAIYQPESNGENYFRLLETIGAIRRANPSNEPIGSSYRRLLDFVLDSLPWVPIGSLEDEAAEQNTVEDSED